ncbi:MAG: EAL domain-containing protein [Sulfuricurvum sp.]|nr:EAL domain-containing protein [Sulfuricurvum sp.]
MIPFTFLKKSEQVSLESSYLKADKHMMWILLAHAFVAIFVTSSYYDTYWLGIAGSLVILSLCTISYFILRGTVWFRFIAAVTLMMFTAIYIQQHLGRIEMHFHVFIGLAILTIYKDTRPMFMASAAIIVHHFFFNWLQSHQLYIGQNPIMIFSYGCGLEYVYLHGVMVAAEAIVLGYIIQDSTKQYLKSIQAEEKLKLSASVFTHAHEGILITDTDGNIMDVNNAFTAITGYTREEAIGQNSRLLNSGRQPKEYYVTMWSDLIDKGHWYGEIWNRRKSGEVYAEMLTISAVYDSQGDALHYVALFSDISAAKEHEKQLQRIAYYDSLTALPNRVLLADRLHQAMTQSHRREQPLAVIYLDLDGFKTINDTHGHDIGDQLLIALSNRMKQTLREGDTLARIGGDEFVAILVDLANKAASESMITRLLLAAAQPVHLDDLKLQVSASIGVTFYPQTQETDADLLMRQADNAMYQAKLAGKNRFHLFDTEHDSNIRSHNENVERIRTALHANEFVLYYQPKVNMRTGKVIGVEALIRWQHPQKGLLAPALFLPTIENHPVAIDLGEWVMNTALTQIELWHSEGLDIPVSVNIGARQLSQGNFVERLQEILSLHPNTKPSCLELEVLETSALDNIEQAFTVIEECRQIGVEFALDDFGTGYSSLTYLKHLPVAMLKIDQTFVRDMLEDPDDLAILKGVIGLATAFHRIVIAEGVETVEHGEMLLQLGCDLAQGYGIARPMPADQLPQWVKTWKPDPKWVNTLSL